MTQKLLSKLTAKKENASQKLSESDINLIKKMINKLSTKEITDLGVKEGAKLVVDGRGLKLQGYENGL